MAKISDLVDDLTGQLSGPSSMGGRSQADPYMQSMQKPAGPVSPYPPIPPVQLAAAGRAPVQSQMPPPMDASASLQQAMMQKAALEGNVMRPPYTQPYSAMAFATAPGFDRAPLNGGLQTPVWNAADGCGLQGPAPRPSPAMQMQAIQQQRMAQLQAQQQAQQAAVAQAKAGQACLQTAQKHKMRLAAASPDAKKEQAWKIFGIVMLIIVGVILALAIAFGVQTVKNGHRIDNIASVLGSPVS